MRSNLIIIILNSLLICAAGQSIAETAVRISVKEMAGVEAIRPVTGGIPLAKGLAPGESQFYLEDQYGQPCPVQYQVLSRWNDGSIRWILLDFQANPDIHTNDQFLLKWSERNKNTKPALPVKIKNDTGTVLSSGKVKLSIVPGSVLRISDRFEMKLVLTRPSGVRCEGRVKRVMLEQKGDIRSSMILAGSFEEPNGKRIVDFQCRASVYAGLSRISIEPRILINSDTGIVEFLNDLSMELNPLNQIEKVAIGGLPGWEGDPEGIPSIRLFQYDDENYIMEGTSGRGSKAPGWMEMSDKDGTIAIALRDFWQQWPKSLGVDSGVLKLGLFPYFEEGSFDHMGPWYKHDYLFEGNSYRLRQGQTRSWEVWMDLSGEGNKLAKAVNHRLVPVADPIQSIGTGEWGPIAPSGSERGAEYDNWADELYEGYCRSIAEQRDYGAMNWGDWWGERQANWGNHEYDTPMHFFLQFARTADPKYFYTGEQATRHMSEVDVVHFVNDELSAYFSQWESDHFPSRPGMVHQHTIGHVGGFHPVDTVKKLFLELNISQSANPYLCLDPFNLGHIWTLGMSYYYLLTGDPWIKETIQLIGDNIMSLTENRKYPFRGWNHVGRINGWSMLALAGLYKIEPSERCLAAMKYIADEAIAEQDPNCGGWLYTLSQGHCNCATKHVGEAGFITSVRLNGLSAYYRLTGDERIPEVIDRGVTHLNRDTWLEKESDWRYTTCPATGITGQMGVTIMALVNNVQINGNQEHLRILRKAWQAKFKRLKTIPSTKPGLGKTYSVNMYGSPEAMSFFQTIF